jgi:L-aminopeptidase/D-esterase-like protein
LGALVIVNSFGEVVVPGTRNFWAWPFEQDGEFGGLGAPPLAALSDAEMPLPLRLREPGMSTTLAVVATNVRLDRPEAKRLAIMAHDGLSRAIRPVHTPYDGDIVFALSVGDHPLADPLQQARLGHLAADCVARAIARAVFNAKGMAGLPGYADAIG